MKMHKSFEVNLNGPRPKLIVFGVACMSLDPPSLFPNLSPNCKPICTPTRMFSLFDEQFIHEEVKFLFKEGITERSQSNWRAQVLVTSEERHMRLLSKVTLIFTFGVPMY